jgi:hypothetical protein
MVFDLKIPFANYFEPKLYPSVEVLLHEKSVSIDDLVPIINKSSFYNNTWIALVAAIKNIH